MQRGERHLEKGGYLVGRQNAITAFLPIPNQSLQSHATSYWINNQATDRIAQELAKMVGGKILGDLHTHPNGTVPSEQDGRYVRGLAWPYHVILADKGDAFDWFCVDANLRGVGLVDSDEQLEGIMEIVAGELSLRDLGQFFLTPGGEVISTRKDGLKFVSIDTDVVRLEDWERERIVKRGEWWAKHNRTLAAATRETGMPPSRVKAAFKKMGWN